MIGLHHQMSYSPAAVAAAAAASSGAPLHQSVSNQNGAGGKSSSGKQASKHKQQQQALAKYNYNCEPLASQWQSPSEARLERYHYEYSDQLDSSHQPGKMPVSGRQQRQQQQVVVQVPARTAQPIVVESLIKCNRSSRGLSSSRAGRRADKTHDSTTNGSANKADSAAGWTSGARVVSEQEQAGRHFLVQQQHQQRELAQQEGGDNNQVLLIMSDDHKSGGGVPFIGRRLPDKSCGTSSSSRKPPPHPAIILGPPPNWDPSQGQRGQQAPVVGRRSHRISLTHQRRQLPTDQPQVIGPLPISAHLQQDHQQLRARGQVSRPQAKCASLSVLDAIVDGPYLVMAQQQPQPDRLVHQASEQQLAGPSLAQLKRHSRRSANGGSPAMRLVRSANKPASLQPSISCSSLVSASEQHLQPEAPVCQDECCRGRRRRIRQPATQVPSSSGPPPELVRCKSKLLSPSSSNLLQLTISSEPQCLMPCCYKPPPTGATSQLHAQRTVRGSRGGAAHYTQVPYEYDLDTIDSQLGGASAGAHHYHDTCQANGSFGEPMAGANQQQLLSGPQRRPSADHSSQMQHHRSQHRHQQQQHRQLHQRSPPPVPSKPVVSSSAHHRQLAADSGIMDENEQVTQMYESLAAELKAKLGNPNRAPILLPPKDYDTLSRQQGKLTGIELRRSTNPQLIGPQVRRSSSTNNAPATITEATHSQAVPIASGKCDADDVAGLRSDANKRTSNALSNSSLSPSSSSPPLATEHRKQQRADTSLSTASSLSPATTSSGSSRSHQHDDEAGSARSSGRGSQATTSELIHHGATGGDSLQRSRSNSSSGLGSISLGGRSPDSARLCSSSSSPASKSSSSEDMRHQDHNEADDNRQEQHQYEELDQRRGKGIENHNPSKVSGGVLWNGRVEVPLKVNSKRLNGNTYLATKQIIY